MVDSDTDRTAPYAIGQHCPRHLPIRINLCYVNFFLSETSPWLFDLKTKGAARNR